MARGREGEKRSCRDRQSYEIPCLIKAISLISERFKTKCVLSLELCVLLTVKEKKIYAKAASKGNKPKKINITITKTHKNTETQTAVRRKYFSNLIFNQTRDELGLNYELISETKTPNVR